MKLSEKKLQDLKSGKIQLEDLYEKYFINSQDKIEAEIIENILKLLNENICDFKEIIDKFKSMKDDWNNTPCLYLLLRDREFFEELIQNNKLNKDDLEYLLNKINEWKELSYLNENTSLLKHIVDNELSQEFVDKFKSMKDFRNKPCLYRLLGNKELFENNKLNREDLRYLSKRIDNSDELRSLCKNTSLVKKILKEFLLDREDVDKFNRIIEKTTWCRRYIHTVFDLIEYDNKNNEEILKLNALNKKIYSFDLNENQKLEIHEILRNNEQAQNTLIQIIDNNLEDQYSFEQLKNILTKDNEKKKIKMNF